MTKKEAEKYIGMKVRAIYLSSDFAPNPLVIIGIIKIHTNGILALCKGVAKGRGHNGDYQDYIAGGHDSKQEDDSWNIELDDLIILSNAEPRTKKEETLFNFNDL